MSELGEALVVGCCIRRLASLSMVNQRLANQFTVLQTDDVGEV